MLKDRAEAQDAVQETFIRAYRAWDSLHTGENLLPWFYRVATNVCLNFIRTKKRKGATPEEAIEQLAHDSIEPSRAFDSRKCLEALIGQLDERSLEIFVGHFIDGMDQGQIAEQLGISRRAVVKRLTALRAKAASIFEGEKEHG
jgi:RNA polymerase sigma-70 factor (ECF subfamily)